MVASWSMFTQNIRIFDPVGCHFKGGKVMIIKKSSLIYSASHTRALTLISMSSQVMMSDMLHSSLVQPNANLSNLCN